MPSAGEMPAGELSIQNHCGGQQLSRTIRWYNGGYH